MNASAVYATMIMVMARLTDGLGEITQRRRRRKCNLYNDTGKRRNKGISPTTNQPSKAAKRCGVGPARSHARAPAMDALTP